MKLMWAGVLAALAAGRTLAGEESVARPVRVAICMDLSGANMSNRNQIRFAAGGASELFAPAGVLIDWRLKGPCERGPGVVEVTLKLQSAPEGRPMKANWTPADNYRMRNLTLGFTAHDLDFIYLCEKSKSKF